MWARAARHAAQCGRGQPPRQSPVRVDVVAWSVWSRSSFEGIFFYWFISSAPNSAGVRFDPSVRGPMHLLEIFHATYVDGWVDDVAALCGVSRACTTTTTTTRTCWVWTSCGSWARISTTAHSLMRTTRSTERCSSRVLTRLSGGWRSSAFYRSCDSLWTLKARYRCVDRTGSYSASCKASCF